MALYDIQEQGRFPMVVGGIDFDDPEGRQALVTEASARGHPRERIVRLSKEMIGASITGDHDATVDKVLPAA